MMSKILFNILGNFFQSIGRKNFNIGNLPMAEKNYSSALEWFEKSQSYQNGFDCQIQLGNIYKLSYIMDVAKEMYNGALVLAKKHNDNVNQVVALINIGMLCALEDDYEASEKAYADALVLAEGNPEYKAKVFHAYGVLEQQKQNYQKSAELFNKAIDTFDLIDLIEPQGLVYQDMGEVYSSLDDKEAARDAWAKSLMVYERNKNDVGMADILLNLGQLLSKEDYIKESMSANNAMGRKIQYANCCTALALIYIDKEDFGNATTLLLMAIDIEIKYGETAGLIRDYANLAMLYKKSGDMPKYETYLDEAMKLAEENEDKTMKDELMSFFALDSYGK